MSDEEKDDKEHEPSQKRLDDARERGEIPRSPDLVTAFCYAGFLLGATALGESSLQSVGSLGSVLLGQADKLAPLFLQSGAAPLGGIIISLLWPMFPFLIFPGLVALLYLLVSKTIIFTPEKLVPKLSRIAPIANAKQKFGRSGLFEFAKNLVKMAVVSCLLGAFILQRADDLVGTLYLSPAIATSILSRLFLDFMSIVLIIAIITGVIDFLWQRAQHLRENRMSRKDLIDESKDQDGDPHVKAQRRQRGYDIATNQMLSDVARADVILVNPTHYAVALKWNKAAKQAPICLAKGTDEIAARIREIAAEAGVPIHSDPTTARALHATIDIGQEIRPEHYRAVAAAIRFAENIRKRARKARI